MTPTADFKSCSKLAILFSCIYLFIYLLFQSESLERKWIFPVRFKSKKYITDFNKISFKWATWVMTRDFSINKRDTFVV